MLPAHVSKARARGDTESPQYGASWPALLEAAREAERLGADMLFDADHFFGPGAASDAEHFECWTVFVVSASARPGIDLTALAEWLRWRDEQNS